MTATLRPAPSPSWLPPASSPLKPPRQRRSEATLARIENATIELLQTTPFADLRLDDIINASDVSRGSFYARFSSKGDLLLHLHQRLVSAAEVELVAAAAEVDVADPGAIIGALVHRYAEFVERHRHLIAAFDAGAAGRRHDVVRGALTGQVADLYLTVVGGDPVELRARVEFAVRAAAAILLRDPADAVANAARVTAMVDAYLRADVAAA